MEIKDLMFDVGLAQYCKDKNCDLATMDKRAFAAYFKAGMKRLEIELLGWDETTKEKRPVLLIAHDY